MAGAIVPHALDLSTITSVDAIEAAIATTDGLGHDIAMQTALHHNVNVQVAAEKMERAAELIQLAIAGSKGGKCYAEILPLREQYVTLIGDTKHVVDRFSTSAIAAIRYVRFALMAMDKQKPETAFKFLAKIDEEAQEMITLSGEMIKTAERVCEAARSALASASDEEASNISRAGQIEEERAKILKAKEDLEETIHELLEEITSTTADAKEAKVEGETREDRLFFWKVTKGLLDTAVSVVAPSLINFSIKNEGGEESKNDDNAKNAESVLTKQADAQATLATKQAELAVKRAQLEQESDKESAAAKALKIEIAKLGVEVQQQEKVISTLQSTFELIAQAENAKLDRALQRARDLELKKDSLKEKKRDANAELRSQIFSLQRANREGKTVQAAIESLGIAVKTIGQMQIIFHDVRQFWKGVNSQATFIQRRLGDPEMLAEIDQESAVNEMRVQAVAWMAIAKFSGEAGKAIGGVVETVFQKDIPTLGEAKQMVTALCDKLGADLKREAPALEWLE